MVEKTTSTAQHWKCKNLLWEYENSNTNWMMLAKKYVYSTSLRWREWEWARLTYTHIGNHIDTIHTFDIALDIRIHNIRSFFYLLCLIICAAFTIVSTKSGTITSTDCSGKWKLWRKKTRKKMKKKSEEKKLHRQKKADGNFKW